MKRNCKKIIISLLIFILLIFCFSQTIFASWDPKIQNLADGEIGKAGNRAIDIFGAIINIIQVTGMGIAVVVLVVIGIKYTMASVSEKAEIKNRAHNYVLGCVLIFSGAAILQIIKMFLKSNVEYI